MKPQFSLRRVLAFITVVCIWAAAVFSVRDPFAVPLVGFLAIAVGSSFVFGIVRRRSDAKKRVFYVGALLGLVISLAVVIQRHHSINYDYEYLVQAGEYWEAERRWRISNLYQVFILFLPLACGVGGLLTTLVRVSIRFLHTLQKVADRELEAGGEQAGK